MGSHRSKFLVIKGFVFRAVQYNAVGSLDHVIPQIAVADFVHGCIFRFEFAGLVLFPDNAAVFGKGIIAPEAFNGAKLSKYPAGIDRADAGHGGQYLVLRGVESLYGSLDCSVYGLKFFFKGADAVERTADQDGQRIVKALIQPVRVLCGLLEQISGLFRVGDPSTAFGTDKSDQFIHGYVHNVFCGEVVRQDCFSRGTIFVRERTLTLVKSAMTKESIPSFLSRK